MDVGSRRAHHPDWWATLIHEAAHTVIGLHFGFSWRGTQIASGTETIGAAMLIDPRRTSETPTYEGAIVAAAGGLAEDWVNNGNVNREERKSDRDKIYAYARAAGGDLEAVTAQIDFVATSLIDLHRVAIEQLAEMLHEHDGRIRQWQVANVRSRLALDCPRCAGG